MISKETHTRKLGEGISPAAASSAYLWAVRRLGKATSVTEGAGEQLRVRARIHIAAQAGQRSREALVAEEKDCETAKRKAGEPAPKARAITRSNSDGNGSGSGKRQLRRANSAGAMPNASRAQRRRLKKKEAEEETTEEEDAPKRWIAKSLTLARLLQQAPARSSSSLGAGASGWS